MQNLLGILKKEIFLIGLILILAFFPPSFFNFKTHSKTFYKGKTYGQTLYKGKNIIIFDINHI